ncbi:MAG: thiolase family protein [Planctomycetota bacterium]|nr:thiolase family protein [Planctomycetota bacterium]
MMLPEPVGLLHPYRLPVGRHGGVLARFEPYKLQAHVFNSIAEQAGHDAFDEVIVGNVRNSIGNIARVAALEAGLPADVPAMTVDRQCASGLEALVLAAAKLNARLADRVLVGGVESASRCPWFIEKTPRAYAYAEPKPYPIRLATPEIGDPPMGETAEILADEFNIDRESMDRFAAESNRRAAAAHEDGSFAEEIVPVQIPQRSGESIALTMDETIRAETTLEALAKLPPVFRPHGRVTAGNSSPLSDGAAACVAMSRRALEQAGAMPLAWLTGASVVALEPARMGLGPALAIPKLLDTAQLTADDIDLFEINEAFAAQILAVNQQLQIPPDKLNAHGGAIALGHPLGASGMRLVVTMIHLLRRRQARRGIVSLCIGGGQGMAALIETNI